MCVIIFIPRGESITREEMIKAWNRNSDGAGYCMQKDGKVEMKRGFMKRNEFIDEVEQYIGKYNIALHFRISTSKAVNPLQTHPYMIENVSKMEGTTDGGVACMNGVVKCDYNKREKWNDTMNYIVDKRETFKVINKDIIDMMEDSTSAKWLLMKPRTVLMSKGFKEKDGRWYSNTYHLNTYNYYGYRKKSTTSKVKTTNRLSTTKKTSNRIATTKKEYDKSYDYSNLSDDDFMFDMGWNKSRKENRYMITPKDFFTPHLINQLKRNDNLWLDINNYIETRCNCRVDVCDECSSCFALANTRKEVEDKINVDYYDGRLEYGFGR